MDTQQCWQVRSTDGVDLSVWMSGDGPPLVLVHGAMSDHTNDAPFVAELARSFTTFAMDRRGRGSSGDAGAYSITQEFADVAAVVDEVTHRAGQPAALWGHSYGADCAMGAATLAENLRGLVIYEPGLGMSYPPGSVQEVEAALAKGDNEVAAVALLARVVELTETEIEFTRSLPTWPARLAIMPTVPRELAAESGWRYQPGQFDRITTPTLVLAGSDSPPSQQEATRWAVAAIPEAQMRVIAGHSHIAHRTDPALVAAILRDFLADQAQAPAR